MRSNIKHTEEENESDGNDDHGTPIEPALNQNLRHELKS